MALVIFAGMVAVVLYVTRANRYTVKGEMRLTQLSAPVRVVRDEKGMAYIYAESLRDGIMAQGFIVAQDRLFQMELTRRFAQGRISEFAGEKAFNLDRRMRTLGFHRNAKKYAQGLSDESREFLQAFIDGLNSYIEDHKNDQHLEFSLAGFSPEPWTIEDSLTVLYYMGWNSGANIETEILTQKLIDTLGPEKAHSLFPVNINPDDESRQGVIPRSDLAASVKGLLRNNGITRMEIPVAPQIGSNNWAVTAERSTTGSAIVANDPHLDTRMMPGPFYPFGLITPEIRAVGVTVPGIPGMIVGRTGNVAVGVTNSYGDAQDLYVETVDPANPGHYMEGNKSVPFEVVTETIRVKEKDSATGFREEKVEIRLTHRGPVVSNIYPGLETERIVTLRWSPFESMNNETGLRKVLLATNAEEMREAIKSITGVMLNMVFADTKGSIGWQTSGRLPVRIKGNGTVPYVVKSAADDWNGWIPLDRMPSSMNPERGWIGTANHNTVSKDYPWYISSYFAASFRYRRMIELFESRKTFSPQDFWEMQRDTKNMLAEKTVPLLLPLLEKSSAGKELASVLKDWDYHDSKEKAAPLVFQELYRQLAIATYSDELGKELTDAMLDTQYFWHERFLEQVVAGESSWFDNSSTEKKEGLQELVSLAAEKTYTRLGELYGNDVAAWKWGEAHHLEFYSPIMREGPLKGILGGGSHSMAGSPETLYRANYSPLDPFNVNFSAALRMVADMGDDEKIMAVMSNGVAGRQFHPHFKDQTEDYMDGTVRYWWFSDEKIASQAESEYRLVPER